MRISIYSVLISKVNLDQAFNLLAHYDYNIKGYVCLPDLSVIIDAQSNRKLLNILNNSYLTLPDGKPIEFIGKLKGEKYLSTVSGYWLVKKLLRENIKHYFYGGDITTIKALESKFSNEFNNGKILGFKSPPFMSLENVENNQEILKDLKEINSLKPDIIWVGISSPKQDYLVSYYSKYLDRGIMIAVGGVFDYLSEKKKISPEWIKKIGFRWLYRLIQEPTRLWKKYFKSFIGLLFLLTIYPLKKLNYKGYE